MDYRELIARAALGPSELKARLPIAYVLERAGHPVMDVDPDGRLHAICPLHPDSSPSLDVMGLRWGCYPCGKGGDVVDLLRELVPGLKFGEALSWGSRLLTEMPPEWAATQGAAYEKREFDPVRALDRVEASGEDVILEGIVEHYGWPDAAWLHRRWRVGAEWNQVLIPYFNHRFELVGLKRRAVGTKALGTPGSKLCLYGAWLDQDPRKDVLICEGESDTWTADRAVGHEVAVMGSPGATYPVGVEELARFEGRAVTLAFDGDSAGDSGSASLAEALRASGALVDIWNLPRGEDIRSYLGR